MYIIWMSSLEDLLHLTCKQGLNLDLFFLDNFQLIHSRIELISFAFEGRFLDQTLEYPICLKTLSNSTYDFRRDH